MPSLNKFTQSQFPAVVTTCNMLLVSCHLSVHSSINSCTYNSKTKLASVVLSF